MLRHTNLAGSFLKGGEMNVERKSLRTYIDEKRTFYFFKRFFDIILSLFFLIVVMSWLTPIVALAIKLSSRGPIFFLQKRVGRGCKIFTCFKFRTMIINPGADFMQAADGDDRI